MSPAAKRVYQLTSVDAAGEDDVTGSSPGRRDDVTDDVTLSRGAGRGVTNAATHERCTCPTQDPAGPTAWYT